jgi:hypothetical protein
MFFWKNKSAYFSLHLVGFLEKKLHIGLLFDLTIFK